MDKYLKYKLKYINLLNYTGGSENKNNVDIKIVADGN
jgi:hypothetical protein